MQATGSVGAQRPSSLPTPHPHQLQARLTPRVEPWLHVDPSGSIRKASAQAAPRPICTHCWHQGAPGVAGHHAGGTNRPGSRCRSDWSTILTQPTFPPGLHPLPRAGCLRSPSWTRTRAEQNREKQPFGDPERQPAIVDTILTVERPKED